MTIWTNRGKDASGAQTYLTTNLFGTFLISDHPTGGVQLYEIVGARKELLSLGFKDIDGAKGAVARMFRDDKAIAS